MVRLWSGECHSAGTHKLGGPRCICVEKTMIHFSSARIQSAFFHVPLSELRGHEEKLMLM